MFKQLGRVLRNQTRNLVRLGTGVPVSPAPMGSMTLDQDDVDIALDCLTNPSEWNDEKSVAAFEQEFASFTGADEAVSFNAGRVALSAILQSLDIGADCEVIVPGYTCVVVPNSVSFAGAKPVYCDIELETYGLDVEEMKRLVSPKTRAIIVQHLYGLVCRDFNAILDYAQEHGIAIIEDCAHSTGARFNGKSVGLFGDAGFFSSEQSKVFNSTCGGVAISRRPDLMQSIRDYQTEAAWPDDEETGRALKTVILNYNRFKRSNRWWKGDVALLKYGKYAYVSTTQTELKGQVTKSHHSRMSGAIARIAANQIRKTKSYNARRCSNAEHWEKWCEQHGYTAPTVIEGSEPVFLRYPVLVEKEFKQRPNAMLKRYGILPGDWFRSHLHPSPVTLSDCPNATIAVSRCVNLPCLLDND